MSDNKHGFSFSVERDIKQPRFILTVFGKLTHQDYLTFTPLIDAVIAELKDKKIDMLVDCQALQGWELQAAWDDFKIGLKHHNDFNNIAIVRDQKWLNVSSQVASWFVKGQVKIFTDLEQAKHWLQH